MRNELGRHPSSQPVKVPRWALGSADANVRTRPAHTGGRLSFRSPGRKRDVSRLPLGHRQCPAHGHLGGRPSQSHLRLWLAWARGVLVSARVPCRVALQRPIPAEAGEAWHLSSPWERPHSSSAQRRRLERPGNLLRNKYGRPYGLRAVSTAVPLQCARVRPASVAIHQICDLWTPARAPRTAHGPQMPQNYPQMGFLFGQ